MFAHQKKSGGLVKLILLIVIALIVLGYFGFDVREIIKSQQVQENLSYGKDIAVMVWGKILAIFEWAWNGALSLIREIREAAAQ